jgi:hypothetical protein
MNSIMFMILKIYSHIVHAVDEQKLLFSNEKHLKMTIVLKQAYLIAIKIMKTNFVQQQIHDF